MAFCLKFLSQRFSCDKYTFQQRERVYGRIYSTVVSEFRVKPKLKSGHRRSMLNRNHNKQLADCPWTKWPQLCCGERSQRIPAELQGSQPLRCSQQTHPIPLATYSGTLMGRFPNKTPFNPSL